MSGSLHRTARIISVIAGTLVALSCGTNVRDISNLISFRTIKLNSVSVCILRVGATIRAANEALFD